MAFARPHGRARAGVYPRGLRDELGGASRAERRRLREGVGGLFDGSQSFTFSASANPIVYQGATPVFVDSEEGTWDMDPVLLEEAIKDRLRKTGRLPKAIVPVWLYGMPGRIGEILEVAGRYGIPVLEDSAEALGSVYKGRKCGTFGDFAGLSFNGNKVITTSGGGALVCRTSAMAKRAMFYATQARESAPHYQHERIGYNYRMSNICAGIGRGQMFVFSWCGGEEPARGRRLRLELLADVCDGGAGRGWLHEGGLAVGFGWREHREPPVVEAYAPAACFQGRTVLWERYERAVVREGFVPAFGPDAEEGGFGAGGGGG